MLTSCYSRLQLWVGYFIYFKFTRVFFWFFNGCSSSIKKINRLLNKSICVVLLDIFDRCSLFQLRKQIG